MSDDTRPDPQATCDPSAEADPSQQQREGWQEPHLTFVEPTLTPHGALTSVTGQFFGAFSPPQED
jgi:hypothetical protein